jgi:hypothetical protein
METSSTMAAPTATASTTLRIGRTDRGEAHRYGGGRDRERFYWTHRCTPFLLN